MRIPQQLERLWSRPGPRRWLLAAAIYCAVTLVLWLCASPEVRHVHTPFNHYALLAEAWLDGRLALSGPPPPHTGNNDFAFYDGRWYVAFPPFPALLLVPVVWVFGGEANAVADGLCFLLLAGIAPAVLFLVIEKLRDTQQSLHSQREAMLLSGLFALGSVYFFSAVQGSVWYAAHVVGAGLSALYAYWSLGARRPLAAGIVLGLAFLTRAPLVLALPLFVFEAWRASRCIGVDADSVGDARPHSKGGTVLGALRRSFAVLDWSRFLVKCAWFLVPLLALLSLALLHNQLRFDAWHDFGYGHLAIRWQERIAKWGLFHYHYLAKNLGVMLTSLPWLGTSESGVPFRINGHGLALWLTTPLYLWLLWPQRRSGLQVALGLTVLCVALPTLFYQNTGWIQFGYRFSNDYAVFLFLLWSLGGHRLGRLFYTCAIASVVVNAFGALSFNRPEFRAYYYIEGTQRVLYQPD